MDPPHLVVLSGLPGTGKTTLSKLLATRLSAAHHGPRILVEMSDAGAGLHSVLDQIPIR